MARACPCRARARHSSDPRHNLWFGPHGENRRVYELLTHPTAPVLPAVLALAGSQAAGLRENFGTMTKPFHAGRAAESGLLAASLAGKGFTTAPDILEARRGWVSLPRWVRWRRFLVGAWSRFRKSCLPGSSRSRHLAGTCELIAIYFGFIFWHGLIVR